MKYFSKNCMLALSMIIGLCGSHDVFAHHSTTMFDPSQIVTIKGVIKEVQWTNPHVAIFITGSINPGDEPAVWLMEMTSPGNLTRISNWTHSSVKAGDKVEVGFFPLRSGKKGGALKKLTLLDTGKVYTTDIRAQENANLDETQPGK
jgi:hypothetical protein